MKRISILCLLALILTILPGKQWAVEKVILKNGINLEEKLAGNNVFLKYCKGIALDIPNNRVYLLDLKFGMIFQVELSTGKLVKTIASKGQGPGQLHRPAGMVLKNDKLFVLDRGFNGVKVFDTSGKVVSEFRFKNIYHGSHRNIDVNEKNEIFLGVPEPKENAMVSVFNMKGEKLRSLVPIEGGVESIAWNKKSRNQYVIKLDEKGNIYLLFFMLRKLTKYDSKGKRLWEIDIKNELLDSYPNDDYLEAKNGTFRGRNAVFTIETMPGGRLLVGHRVGGAIHREDGTLEKIIQTEFTPPHEKAMCPDIIMASVDKNTLVSVFSSNYIFQFEL